MCRLVNDLCRCQPTCDRLSPTRVSRRGRQFFEPKLFEVLWPALGLKPPQFFHFGGYSFFAILYQSWFPFFCEPLAHRLNFLHFLFVGEIRINLRFLNLGPKQNARLPCPHLIRPALPSLAGRPGFESVCLNPLILAGWIQF